MSRTVTVKLPVALLPCASVAVDVHGGGASAKVLPEEVLNSPPTLPSTMSRRRGNVIHPAPAALVASP